MGWLLSLIGIVPNILTTVEGITAAIANEKLAQITAQTDLERIASQERVAALESRRDVLIADAQKSRIDMIMRFIIAIGPALLIFKLFFWDKLVGSLVGCAAQAGGLCTTFRTDALSDTDKTVLIAVISFYLLYQVADNFKRK